MSRYKRRWFPGATYHVMSRGNRKVALFNDKEDYLLFLYLIKKVKRLYPFKIHSICLMTNHFHMVLETIDIELGRIMQRILLSYAVNYNKKYNFTGHLFENRYNAYLIETETYFLEVSRYIHLNPVKAHMVSKPIEYEYSSYRKFLAVKDLNGNSKIQEIISELVDESRVLSCFLRDPREQYRMFVEGKISHSEEELLIKKDIKEDD